MLGAPINRVDGRAKVTGRAKYAAEYHPQGMKYGWLVQSTIARGTIESIDDSKAKAVPGVVAVITYKNAPKVNEQVEGGFDNPVHLLQNNRIHHDRQGIGVVVADNLEAAIHAASLLDIKYKVEQADTNIHGPGRKEIAPPDNPAMGVPTDTTRGDIKAGLAQAKHKIDATYIIPREVHCPMEPHATTAAWSGNTLTVWEATQGVSGVQQRLAHIFSLPKESVRVICKYTGGGFGCKGSVWVNTPMAALAAKVVNAPVCLNMNRSQTFGTVGFRPYTEQHIQIGCDEKGRLTVLTNIGRMEGAKFSEYVEYVGMPTRFLYSCPNVEAKHRVIELDIGKPTFMRAPGEAEGTFALESAMDELAIATNIDPLEFRLINHADKDEQKNLPYSSKNLKECYRVGAERFGWSKRNAKPGSVRVGNKLVGVGMATATYPVHAFPAKATARLNSDGTVLVRSGTQDIGTGTYTIMTQIAADALGLPLEKVTFELGDTTFAPAGVSGGSTTAACVGTAVKEACEELLEKLATMSGGEVKSLDPNSYAAILAKANQTEVEAESGKKVKADRSSEKYSMHSFGAHFCEVAVDVDTNEVRVTRWVSVMDAGKIFNHKTATSQIAGGVTMGIGMALTEESLVDSRYGRTMNADLGEYHVPVHADMPVIDVSFVEVPDYNANPLGGHGIGEIGITGVAAAVANAVYNATGVRIRELPITLDKVMQTA